MSVGKSLSLVSRSLKRKLVIVFSLMSVIPIAILLNYIFPSLLPPLALTNKLIIIAGFIALLGFWMLKEIIDSFVRVSSEAKIIARGDYGRSIAVEGEDEIGDLSVALNQMTSRIRSTMQELRQYSEKTKDINVEIQKRVGVLSGLLQISDLISKGEKISSILEFGVGRLAQVSFSEVVCFLSFQDKPGELKVEAASGLSKSKFPDSELKLDKGLFADIFGERANVAVDNESLPSENAETLRNLFGIKNLLLFSVISRGKDMGILVVGNNKDNFSFGKEDLETTDIFAKQIAVCIENDALQKRVRSLEIKDALTGLFNKMFIKDRLDEEIKKAAAYQKPCSFLILNINNFKDYHSKFGALSSELVLKRIAGVLELVVSDIDILGRTGDDEFSAILPARNKRQSISLSEEIKTKVAQKFAKEEDQEKRITVSAGISENPLDGSDGATLMSKARQALKASKK